MEWLSNNWETIVSAVIALISIIVGVILDRKSSNEEKKSKLFSLVSEVIVEAEQMFGSGNGVSKLNYAVTKLMLKALQTKTKVTENEIVAEIEKQVSATNQVNVSKTESTPRNEDSESASPETQTENIDANNIII